MGAVGGFREQCNLLSRKVQCSNLALADRIYVGCLHSLFELDVPEAKPSAKAPQCKKEASAGFWAAACASVLPRVAGTDELIVVPEDNLCRMAALSRYIFLNRLLDFICYNNIFNYKYNIG